ncbi:phosphatase [Aureococcus anophagefferens]|nr:phosphatase [Aureococcus anophagefferens]
MRGQSLNRAAILTTLNIIFRRPGLLVPHVSVPHLGDLDFLSLKASGVEYVVLDKDNTLTAPYDDDAPPHPLRAAPTAGFAAAEACEAALGLKVVRHPAAKKPNCLSELLAALGADDASRVAVVGDRVTTDVLFANLHGALSVHTAPLTTDGDNRVAAACRAAENAVLLPALRRLGARPPRHDALADLVHTQAGVVRNPRW